MRKQQYLVWMDLPNGARRSEYFIAVSKGQARKDVLNKYPEAKRIDISFIKFVSV
jgi:hypothetical protein